MVQRLTVAALTSLVLGGMSACKTTGPEEPQPTDTAFILMGASTREWSRPDASEEAFKREARFCLDNSADARASSPAGGKADAAYRTFHECMERHKWRPPAYGSEKRYIRPHETRPEEYGAPKM